MSNAVEKVRDALHILFACEKVRPDSPEANADVTDSERTAGFRLIAIEPLVRMKLSAFRDKDRMHLRDLIEVGLVDTTWPARLPQPLRDRLRDVLNNPEN